MLWIFGIITVGAVVVATFERVIRRAILALWIAGIGVGAIYLVVGAEFLAIMQWIVATLEAISFIFFAVMFGEYHKTVATRDPWKPVLLSFGLLIGMGFVLMIGLGSHLSLLDLDGNAFGEERFNGLILLGQKLTQEHMLGLEVLSLTLFLVLVGGGVIARFDRMNSPGSKEL